MTRSTKPLIPTLLAAALILAPAVLLAHGPMRPRGPMGHHGPFGGGDGPGGPGLLRELIGEHLGLSDQQREEIHALMESHRDEADTLHGDLAEAREALADATHSDELDEAAIRAAAARVAEREVEAIVFRARVTQEIKSVLTPEQQAELRQLRQRRQELRGRMRERALERRFGGD